MFLKHLFGLKYSNAAYLWSIDKSWRFVWEKQSLWILLLETWRLSIGEAVELNYTVTKTLNCQSVLLTGSGSREGDLGISSRVFLQRQNKSASSRYWSFLCHWCLSEAWCAIGDLGPKATKTPISSNFKIDFATLQNMLVNITLTGPGRWEGERTMLATGNGREGALSAKQTKNLRQTRQIWSKLSFWKIADWFSSSEHMLICLNGMLAILRKEPFSSETNFQICWCNFKYQT